LDATASVAGSFAYSPASGALLTAGSQTLSVTFTPTDTTDYNTASSSVTLTVNKVTPTITWATPSAVTVGTILSSTQLDASSSVTGTFVYLPASGTTLSSAGTTTLSTTFTPGDTTDYNTATDSVSLTVTSSTAPSYAWNQVKIVAGGYVPGVYFSPAQQNLRYARTDVGGAYRWGPTDTAWVPLLDWTTRANYGQLGVEAIGVDPVNANNVYVAVGLYASSSTVSWANYTAGAMLVSTNQGASFTTVPLGFYNGSNDNGRNTGERIAVDPNLNSIVYYGTRSAGLQISTNAGLAWAKSTGLTLPSTGVTQPSGATSVGTANGNGVIAVLPVKSSGTSGTATPVVYAAVAGTGSGTDPQGLYVSTNAGTASATWTAVSGQPSLSGKSQSITCKTSSTTSTTASLAPLQAKLGPNGHVYILYGDQVGPGSMNCNQLWEFTPTTGTWTAGAWSQITLPNAGFTINNTNGYGGIAVDPSTANVLLLSTLGQYWPTGDVIYRSNDDGVTWRDVSSVKLPNSSGSASPALATHDSSLSPWLAFDESSSYVSTGNWATSMAIDPYNSAHAMYGTGQTIWNTTDLTTADPSASSTSVVAWAVGAGGVEETVVNILLAPPSGNTLLLSGVDDLYGFAHTNLSVSPAQQMFSNPQAPPSSMDFEQNTPTTVVRVTNGTKPYGVLSSDGGLTWTAFAAMPTGTTAGGGTIAIAADGSSMVWATADTSSVWYSSNGGATWTAASGLPAQAQVASDRVKAGVYYGYSGTTLYLSTNSGATWTAQQSGLPSSAVLVTLPDAQGDIYLAGSQWSSSGLYSNTGTAASPTLTALSSVTTAYHLGFGKATSGATKPALYLDGVVSGATGIFRSVDGGASWVQINDSAHVWGMLDAVCGDMRTFGTVYLATGGRGIIWGTSSN
jgi:hypothetical protein